MSEFSRQASRRRTFAIISHPDAGKTTLTEKLLLFGGAIQLAGTIKARKAARHATSDWMQMEQERGISVTSSVMQFHYRDHVINLLDTPGHEDFSEDTYRTLTAVDSALMVIDVAKGVEERTIKLMEVCRLRDTPIITFINKLDREGQDLIDLMDEIEDVLKIKCAPLTWPIGVGKGFKGVYHFYNDASTIMRPSHAGKKLNGEVIKGLDNPDLTKFFDPLGTTFREEVELVRGASHIFDHAAYLRGEQTPILFGSAINNFGVQEILDVLVDYAPGPLARPTLSRKVEPDETGFSGFIFKIQANMDPQHRDRIAFLRICSGKFEPGMKMRHVRMGRDIKISNAITFLAQERGHVDEAWAGDIIGLHNHGTIQLGDTFTTGEEIKFTGIPHFAPELFRRAVLKTPLKSKQLLRGLQELSEEGATQLFRPFKGNDLILGAVGILQFEVVEQRLRDEYRVDAQFEPITIATARWIECDDDRMCEEFRRKAHDNLAEDIAGDLAYMAPTRVNLALIQERWPDIRFRATREH